MLTNGHLIAGAPVFRRNRHDKKAEGCGISLSRSEDKGETWKHVHQYPCPAPVEFALFDYENRLYMLITPHVKGEGSIWVTVSDDGGTTWSDYVEVLKGPHKMLASHQLSMVVQNGYLYWAVSEKNQRLAVVACKLEDGLLNPDSWRISNFVDISIPKELDPGIFSGPSMKCLEGNVVNIDGRLRVMARTEIDQQGTANLAAVYDLHDADDVIELKFTQFYPIPGGQCKFFILYDERSELYWMASNLPANSQNWIPNAYSKNPGNDRRFLMLSYSCDALNWFPAGCIAKAETYTQSFHYASMEVDGDDLAIVVRTSLDSGDNHDSDALTFHRVHDFRNLAMDLMSGLKES